jgi:Glycosyl hydrolases family 2, sugar binding domain/Glycosyl hydrolases family 2, TIM barrel domain/Glycosyl hydrolases family 2
MGISEKVYREYINFEKLVIVLCMFFAGLIQAQPIRPNVHPNMLTSWGKTVSPENVYQEYPRPQLVRPEWLDLNGQWDLHITRFDQTNLDIFSGRILVPYPVESILSGVKHVFTEQEQMCYQRTFMVPTNWQGQRVLLHFEAVDWKTTVLVNNQEIGKHQGGYDHFSFDITDALNRHGDQTLTVLVMDPTETGSQPLGKQMMHSHPPFFSASAGIWQTVWLEPVPATYIQSLKLVPDIDRGVLRLAVLINGNDTNQYVVEAVALDGSKEVSRATGPVNKAFDLPVSHAKSWSPDYPFLYDLKITLQRKGKQMDAISSYFGMRKISMAKDSNGYPRLMLNNHFLFELGVLDSGYWPDGIYTAPSDEALRYDVETMKQLGFNLCRMHVKVEADRWYYWCDKLGLMVWQDMPNTAGVPSEQEVRKQQEPPSAKEFENELTNMIIGCGNHPCIVVWIPFNQGWGQYDTVRIADTIKAFDPSRLVINASGWYDLRGGDIRSLHKYPGPAQPEYDGKRACVEGECGGLALIVPHHSMWGIPGYWNVTYFQTADALTSGYAALMSEIQNLAETNGLSGAVVAQLSDVETELDGFMTYDREVMKIPPESVAAINQEVIQGGSAAK